MRKEIGLAFLLAIICGIVAWCIPTFHSLRNLENQAVHIGIFGIFSIGAGMVIITGGIDLSVGSAFALEGIVLAILLVEQKWAWPIAVLAVIAGMVALGIFHGLLITKMRLQPFIVTLCGLLIYRGMASEIANDETKGFGSKSFGILRTLATGHLGPVPMPFVFLIVVAVVMYIVLHRSVYGRYLYAVGQNEEAARYSGINTSLVIGSVYALSMFLAAISGLLEAFDINSVQPSEFGKFYELYGIAAAVVGGCSLRGGEGSIIGIILGTILLQILQNIVNLMGIRSSLDWVVAGSVILISAVLDEILRSRLERRKSGAGQIESPPAESQ